MICSYVYQLALALVLPVLSIALLLPFLFGNGRTKYVAHLTQKGFGMWNMITVVSCLVNLLHINIKELTSGLIGPGHYCCDTANDVERLASPC